MAEGYYGPPPGGFFGPPPGGPGRRGPHGGPPRGGFDGFSPAGNNWNRRSWYGRPEGYASTPDYDLNVAIFPRLRTLVKCAINKENNKLWFKHMPEIQAQGLTLQEAKKSGKFKLQRAKNVLKGTLFGVGRYIKEPFVNFAENVAYYDKQKEREFGNITDNECNLAQVNFDIKQLGHQYDYGEINLTAYREGLKKIKDNLANVSRAELDENNQALFDALEGKISEEINPSFRYR